MSQQLRQGARYGRGMRGHGGGRVGSGKNVSSGPKAYKSKIAEICDDTFNVGSAKFIAQF